MSQNVESLHLHSYFLVLVLILDLICDVCNDMYPHNFYIMISFLEQVAVQHLQSGKIRQDLVSLIFQHVLIAFSHQTYTFPETGSHSPSKDTKLLTRRDAKSNLKSTDVKPAPQNRFQPWGWLVREGFNNPSHGDFPLSTLPPFR